MILPGFYNLITMLGGLAMLPAIVCNIVSGKFEEIYTPPKPRKGRKNDDGPSYSLQLFYQIGGVSREGRGGRMFVLTLYTVANLYVLIGCLESVNRLFGGYSSSRSTPSPTCAY